jgi:putative aminopeptidase FrvX
MDNLISKIFSLQAESKNAKQQNRIQREFLKLCPKNIEYYFDTYGNLYITKGKSIFYPCYVAHVDQVHTVCDNFKLHQEGNILFATGYKAQWKSKYKSFQQVGVGGDDKAGIYICLQMLLNLDACKVVLFQDEEIGCIGSSYSITSFFDDCSFIGQADRRSNNDFITFTNGVETATPEFITDILPTLAMYGYKEDQGTMTDVGQLIINGAKCVAFNASCGYYNAHTDQEYQNLRELEDCKNLFLDIAYYSNVQYLAPLNDTCIEEDEPDFYDSKSWYLERFNYDAI